MVNPIRGLRREPLHPPTTHFPMALFPMAVVFDLLALARDSGSLYTHAAFVVMIVALGSAGVAATTGFIHLVRDVSPASRAWRVALFHMGTQLTAVSILLISLLLRLGHVDDPQAPTTAILLSALGTGLLLFGGWLGGRLVYHYAISVRPRDSTAERAPGNSEHQR